MTQITSSVKTDMLASLRDADGMVKFTPSSIRTVGADLIVPRQVTAMIVAGVLTSTVNLSPTDGKFYWTVELTVNGVAIPWAWTVSVPNVSIITLTDLVTNNQVSPNTFARVEAGSSVASTLAAFETRIGQVTTPSPGVVFMEHGAVAGAIRPVTAGQVIWVGSAQPTQWVDGDVWLNAAPVVTATPSATFPVGAAGRWETTNLSGGDGAAFTTIPDIAGANPMAQTGGAVLKTAGGYSRVLLDGVDDFLNAGLGSSVAYTRIFLARYVVVAVSKPLVGSGTLAAAAISISSTNVYEANAGSNLRTTITPNTSWHLFEVYMNGAASSIYVDGILAATGSSGANTASTFKIGANTASTTFSNVEFAAGAQFAGELTRQQAADIKSVWTAAYPGTI